MKITAILAAFSATLASAWAADSVVVFNEIAYQPAPGQPEFIELRNLHGVDVNVAGWKIDGGVDFTFPAGTIIPGGGHAVIGAVAGSLGNFSGQLDNGGETLRLRNLNGRIMDEVNYDDEGDWPVGADGSGATLARRAADAVSGAEGWTAGTRIGGTPGTQNFFEGATAVRAVVVAIGDSWKYEDSGAVAPAGWQGVGFDDASWKAGATLIAGGGGKLARGLKPNALSNGLLAYWAFNENGGLSAANGVAGQPNGTMANGATFVNDATRGWVASFDGTDDRMEVINPSTGLPSLIFLPSMTSSNDFTWAAWVWSTIPSTQGDQAGSVILGNRTNPSGQEYSPREFIKIMPREMQYHRQAATESLDYADLGTSAWTHMCVVKRGLSLDYYRNGVFVQTRTISGGLSNPMPFFVGGDRMVSINEHFAGRVDDVALWTRALSATEVGQIGSEYGVTPPLPNPPEQTTTAVTGAQPRYFRKVFNFNGTPNGATVELWPVADDGAVFYLNGSEVYRTNVPPISEAGDAQFPIAPITISNAALLTGSNVLSAEVHQFPGGNTDLLFGAQLVTTAIPGPPPAPPASLVFTEISGANDANFFIELRNTSGGAVDTNGWTIRTSSGQSIGITAQTIASGGYLTLNAAALGFTPADGTKVFLVAPGDAELHDSRAVTNRLRGLLSDGSWGHPDSATPGGPNLATIESAIVINEIYYHAPGTSPEQWIELHNRTAADVNIAGWKFTDGVSYQFPVGTIIPANGFRVLAWDPTAFAALHAGVTALGPWSGSLSRKGETLTLRDASDNIVNQLTYGENGRWSQWADGGGSSLELRDRDADIRAAEAWDSSDESLKTGWQTVTYGGLGAHATTSSIAYWNEFIVGLLDDGEILIDDVSVTESGNQLIQNGGFDSGANTWRNIGNHQLSTVVDDPFAPGNKVLKIVATGATEHMSNHCETTLKQNGAFVALDPAKTYTISFRAKWLRGTNRLHTRLYFNRLPRQTLLNIVSTGGTPGAVNSRAINNAGPTFSHLSATPVVPAAGQPSVVGVRIADRDNVSNAELFFSVNGGAFNSTAMTQTEGVFSGVVPAQSANALVQFYVRATDALGAQSFFPAGGPTSRAMIPWADGKSIFTLPSGARPHNIRVVLPPTDTNDLYKAENVMSNHYRPCTVIYDDRLAYYHASTRLKSSEHGRFQENRVGFNLRFGTEEPFLGAHETVSVDRSGNQGTGGIDGNTTNSVREILIKSVMTAAGGIHAVEDDIVRLIAPVATSGTSAFDGAEITGAALLSKSRFDDEYLDNQWPQGSNGMFKQEYIYPLSQTIDPVTRVVGTLPENLKIPQTGGSPGPSGINVSGVYGSDKEAYRWHWLIRDSRTDDNYAPLLAAVTAVGQVQGSPAFKSQTNATLEVNTWLRAVVVPQLFGVTDNYLGTNATHNFLLFFPAGGKGVAIPWDLDFLAQTPGNEGASFTNGGDIAKFIADPVNKRAYYGHVLDVLDRSFNSTHLTRWAQHYSRFSSEDMTSGLSYLTTRATNVRNALTTLPDGIPFIAFNRTTPSPMTVSTPFATVGGKGWINIAEIRLLGSAEPLAVTWTDQNSWTLQLPVNAGTNVYTLRAFDNMGAQVGSTTVTVTGTGGVFPAGPGNLVISELHYNPAGTGIEFLELLNVSGTALDLSGCHFDEELGQGIAYTFPAGVQVAAGGRVVLTRYPGTGAVGPSQYVGGLDNSGETIVLYSASGLEIFRTSYLDDLASTDGGGRSLVRVLSSTNPNGQTAVWRPSVADGGNPGTSDNLAFSGNALSDDDGDGLLALLEYALGTSEAALTWNVAALSRDSAGVCLLTFPHAIASDDAALTIEAVSTLTGTWTTANATLVSSVQNGAVATETWRIIPPAGSTNLFLRLRATRR